MILPSNAKVLILEMLKFNLRSRYLRKISIISIVSLTFCTLYILGVFIKWREKDFYTEFNYPYEGDVNEIIGKLRNGIDPGVHPIYTNRYSFTLNPTLKCKAETVHLTFLIKTAPGHFKNRKYIRKTWGNESLFPGVQIKRVFLIGQVSKASLQENLEAENEMHQDILQANFTDTYYNNTHKTMMAFQWAEEFCSNSKYYMFVDDDYYVSQKNLLKLLGYSSSNDFNFELHDKSRFYTGFVQYAKPIRILVNKFYISLGEYPYNLWPPFINGGSYVLSRNALSDMFYGSLYIKKFRFDDVYLGIISFKIGIELSHNEHFYRFKRDYYNQEDKKVIAVHEIANEELLQLWNQEELGNT